MGMYLYIYKYLYLHKSTYLYTIGIRANFDVLGLALIFEKKGQKPGNTGQIHGFGG
jgi:hypothetical protein